MIVFQGKFRFSGSDKRFTELAGLYYAAQYADNLIKSNGTVFIFKTGHIYDIAVVPKIETDNITIIKDKAEYFIEVKGTKEHNPTSIRVCNTYEKLTINNIQKYCFYIIYNIGLNKIPGLTIFNWAHYQKRSHLSGDDTYHILKVHKDVKNGLIQNYPDIFKSLDIETKNIILDSFREGRLIGDTKQYANISEKTFIDERKDPIKQERNNIMQYAREEINNDFIKFIYSLGPDIKEKPLSDFLSFSSFSNRTGIRQRLCWIDYCTRVGRTVIIRKETLQYKYPKNINEISGYVDGKKSKYFHYPYFKINTVDDLEKAKIIIKFAYDKL